MSTNYSQVQDSSVLGDSWVIAAKEERTSDQVGPTEQKHPPSSQPLNNTENSCLSESMATSSCSISGPELVMPSIYEAPISEASWVAPNIRSRARSSQQPAEKRRKTSGNFEPKRRKKPGSDEMDDPASPVTKTKRMMNAPKRDTPVVALTVGFEKVLRMAINLLLATGILHLLILPELIYQYRSLCTISGVARFYPTSCVPRHPLAQNSPISSSSSSSKKPESLADSQTRLESLLNTTIQDLSSFTNHPLKQSESDLRHVYGELRKTYPGAKHELDLEFHGCWQAVRSAANELDSLKADMRSAIDNLIVTGSIDAKEQQGPTTPHLPPSSSWNPRSEFAKGTRKATQILHRERYLDKLTSSMRSKAGSLSNHFATLDDHLESIEQIVARQEKPSATTTTTGSSEESNPASNFRAFFDSVVSGLPDTVLLLRPFRKPDHADAENSASDGNSLAPPPPSVSERFRTAACRHRPVADVVRRFSQQLLSLQRSKGH